MCGGVDGGKNKNQGKERERERAEGAFLTLGQTTDIGASEGPERFNTARLPHAFPQENCPELKPKR